MKWIIFIFFLFYNSNAISVNLIQNTISNNDEEVNIVDLIRYLINYNNIITYPLSYYISMNTSSDDISTLLHQSNVSLYKSINISFIDKSSPKTILDSFISYILSSYQNKHSFKEVDPDADPPKPYTSNSIPCTPSSCPIKKLKWMKCTVKSVTLRTAYEFINIILNTLAKTTYGVCGCIEIPSSNKQVKCTLTRSYPGVPCNVMLNALKGIFKISMFIWKAYTMNNSICLNPISPL